MSEAAAEKAIQYDPDTYQRMANSIAMLVSDIMNDMVKTNVEEYGEGGESHVEIAPIVQGVLGGAALFCVMHGVPDDKVRGMFSDVVDMMPQFRQAAAMLGKEQGRA